MRKRLGTDRTNAPLFPELSDNPWLIHRAPAQITPGPAGLTTLELCAGAGGQALGLEMAGISHEALVEIDKNACQTLRLNRPAWKVLEQDLKEFSAKSYKGVDIVSGGLPCPPFSVAGKQLGERDERNLFPTLIRIVGEVKPRAVMIENVRGVLDAVFFDYRRFIKQELGELGYQTGWHLMNASDFGVSQLRPRVVFIALKKEYAGSFSWPAKSGIPACPVGELLHDLMAANGWKGVDAWRKHADEIAPTVVGGSHKHGGPDLGPTRARRAWEMLNVDGRGVANEAPARDFVGMPRLTVRMVARLQGFPDDWQIFGKKTASYKQVGNAFPPPFAKSVAERLRDCLISGRSLKAVG